MANSAYYYEQYKKKCEEISKYQKNIMSLREVLSGLTSELQDKISNVNNELDALLEDLLKGVRQNSSYTTNARQISEKKEKGVDNDAILAGVKGNVEDEISNLMSKKEQAENARDDFYRAYCDEKAREDEEARQAEERARQEAERNAKGGQ